MTNLKRASRQVQAFTKVDLLAAGEIHLSQADEFSLIIEAEDSILDYLTTEVENGVLRLDVEKDRNITSKRSIRYFITMPKIEVIRVSGGGKLFSESIVGAAFLLDIAGAADIEIAKIEVNAFTFDVKGAGKATIGELKAQGISFDVKGTLDLKLPALTAEAVTTNIAGTCTMELGGETTAQIIHAPGLINYHATHLQSSQVTVNAKGMANITLWVQDILTVKLGGVGNLRYYGNPERSVKINGMGHVQHLGDVPKEATLV